MDERRRTAPITAVVVDSGDVLDAALQAEPDVDVVARVSHVAALRDTLWRTVPDALVLVVDPAIDPVAISRELSHELPVCRILLVSREGDAPFECVAAGAAGVVAIDELLAAPGPIVRRVARGEAILSQRWAEQILRAYEHEGAPRLTATEREVLQRLANGSTSESIAGLHEVPARLVRLHAAFAMTKLHEAAGSPPQDLETA